MSPKKRERKRPDFHYEGFAQPNYTQVPDDLFDQLLPHLREAQLKALLYIIRRTFGFKKRSDAISFNQFIKGIKTRDGKVIDHGCGVRDRTTLSTALQDLEDMGIIVCQKSMDERGENETTIYSLRFRGHEEPGDSDPTVEPPEGVVGNPYHRGRNRPGGVVGNSHHRSRENLQGVVGDPYPQETVKQKTVKQEHEQQHMHLTHADQEPNESVVVALTEKGVTKKTARELAGKYPQDMMLAQVDMLEYRPADDPAAVLVKAIREDWAPPAGYEPPQEREARERREAERQAELQELVEAKKHQREGWRERMISRHEIGPGTLETWSEVQRQLPQYTGQVAPNQLFERALMLPPQGGTVKVLFESYAQKHQVTPRQVEGLEIAVAAALGRAVKVEFGWES